MSCLDSPYACAPCPLWVASLHVRLPFGAAIRCTRWPSCQRATPAGSGPSELPDSRRASKARAELDRGMGTTGRARCCLANVNNWGLGRSESRQEFRRSKAQPKRVARRPAPKEKLDGAPVTCALWAALASKLRRCNFVRSGSGAVVRQAPGHWDSGVSRRASPSVCRRG